MKLFAAGLALLCSTLAATAADPVAEFGRNYPAFQRGQFKATEHSTPDPKAPADTVDVRQVWMDPPQWKILYRGSFTSRKDGKTSTYTSQSEALYPSVGKIIVNVDLATGRAEGSCLFHAYGVAA